MDVSLPLGDFKYVKFGSLTEDDSIKGEISKLEFNIIDKPITSPIIQSDKDGVMEFDSNNIIQIDGASNKKVSFNILNNDKVATSGVADQNYEVLSFTGQRVSNDTIIPGNIQINTYLGVNEAIFGNKHIYAGTYLQTALGVVKFKDIQNDGWRDLQYHGTGMTTATGTIQDVSGLYIEDVADNFEVVVTSGNISTVVNSLNLIPDISSKADKLNIKFLRYNEILSDGTDKFELLTTSGESIDINLSTHFTNQGSVYVDGKKAPSSTITFTFEASKNYITFSSAPSTDVVIEIERIFI